ncbi:Holliday junction branch migration protein RuvA [Desulfovibrio sp. OttesenSCG-928-A18]|nr:Holliday junction branch migration protein RuvA [Desulfovibrio sp. OttesenSCG-928-A18]
MIAYVEGRIAEITENACILVSPGGVGYEVFLAAHTLARLPERGESVFFYTATVVREDALELYGFDSWDERECFLVLISISRVGARTATAILSVFRPDDLRRMVAEDDMLSLQRVSGIGKKTGQQIFLELKYKLKASVTQVAQGGGDPAAAGRPGGVLADTVAGLVNLGYDEQDALQTARQVLRAEADLDVSGALRAALKALARGRS